MKYIVVIRSYLKGIRFMGSVLAILMTWAILCGIITYGKVQYIRTDVDLLSNSDSKNAYLLSYFPNASDMSIGSDMEHVQMAESKFEAVEAVENVFSIRVVGPVMYEDKSISLVLYEPEMLDFFPALKENGLDFSNEPNGCVLGGQGFGKIKSGEEIQISVGGEKVSVPVCGRLSAPYHRMSLSNSSTNPSANDLFTEGDAIIMQATDEVIDRLQHSAKRTNYDTNLIVVFNQKSKLEGHKAIISRIAPMYIYCSFDEIIKNSEKQISKTLKQELPMPLFLAVTSIFAFFSVSMLVFKKKQQELAIIYLCGFSRFKCGLINFSVYQLLSLPSILFNLLFVQIWPQINWQKIYMQNLLNPNVSTSLLRFTYYFQTIKVNNACLIVVLCYYVAFAVISFCITISTMARNTPATYLRGVIE